MNQEYCMGCMRRREPGERVCPVCGQDHYATPRKEYALPPGTVLYGKYLIGKDLGKGGFGITYLGLDLSLDLKVAVKEYFPGSTASRERGSSYVNWSIPVQGQDKGRNSFLKEARRMAKMDRIPNIVHVRDFFRDNNTAYIVMDFIEGETLLQRLERTGIMDAGVCFETLRPVMEALAKAHDRGLIHRDISPDNIMIDREGEVWLLDLGAAKVIDSGETTPDGHSPTSTLVVKNGFSPMEQYAETGSMGPWMDIYSLCATMFYCITGKLVPDAPGRAIDKKPLVFPPSVPPEVAAVLEKGLALHPTDRWSSMGELTAALDRAVHSGGAEPVPRPVPRPVPEPEPEPESVMPSSVEPEPVEEPPISIETTTRSEPVQPVRRRSPAYAAAAVLALLAAVILISGVWSSSSRISQPDDPAPHAVSPEIEPETAPEPVNPVVDRGVFGQNLSWTLYRNGILELTGSGDMSGYDDVSDRSTNAGAGWWDHMAEITALDLPDGLTSIGRNAFNGAVNLTEADLPDSVTVIDNSAFRDCSGLLKVTLGRNTEVIGEGAFKNCTSLKLSDAALPGRLVSVENAAFEGCTSLAAVLLPDSVTTMGNSVFRGCSGLTGAALPDNLSEIPEKTFSGCSSLEKPVLPSHAQSVGYGAFFGCSSLTALDLPDSVTTIGGSAFQSCAKLSRVGLPSGVTAIGEGAFYECASLTDMVLPDGVQTIADNLFAHCTRLASVTIPGGVTTIGKAAFESCSALSSAGLPDGIAEIGAGAFRKCTGLTALRGTDSVVFPDSLTRIGDEAFAGCSRLEGVFVPDQTTVGTDAFTQPEGPDSTTEGKTVVVRASVLIEGQDNRLDSFVEDCDRRYFSKEEINRFDYSEGLFARNAVYAKSGQSFTKALPRTYFTTERFPWYAPTGNVEESDLNDWQKVNLTLVVLHDYQQRCPGRSASAEIRLRYFMKYCDSEYFDESVYPSDRFPGGYLSGFDQAMCRKAVAAVYARAGYLIEEDDLRESIETEFALWGDIYEPQSSSLLEALGSALSISVDDLRLNSAEKANLALIQTYADAQRFVL